MNRCQVHAIHLDVSESERTVCRDILSQEEVARSEKFVRSEHRHRWIVARAGLRRVLADYCSSAPESLEFGSQKYGKPFLVGDYIGPHFNLSHSGDLALVAVTEAGPVGVDVEYKRPIRDWQSVAKRFFSPLENELLASLNDKDRLSAFYCCWTRKEAVIKATGEGLTARLDSFDVSLTPDAPAQILDDRRRSGNSNWRLENLYLGEEFVGAVALRSPFEVAVDFHGCPQDG